MTLQPTTLAARDLIKPQKRTLRQKVLDFIVHAGEHGCTDEEIQRALGMNANTERPRRGELQQMGLIKDSGNRRKTLTRRNAIVWMVKQDDGSDKQKTLF
jgi:hypothetical protein